MHTVLAGGQHQMDMCMQEEPYQGWHQLSSGPLSMMQRQHFLHASGPECDTSLLCQTACAPVPAPTCRSSAPGSVVTAQMNLAPVHSMAGTQLYLACLFLVTQVQLRLGFGLAYINCIACLFWLCFKWKTEQENCLKY